MACEFRMKLKCVPIGVIYDKLSLVQKIARRWTTYTGHWQKPTTQVTVSFVCHSHTHYLSYFVCTRQLYPCHLTTNMNICPNRPVPFAPIMITLWHRYYLSFDREIYRSLMDSPQKGPVWETFDVSTLHKLLNNQSSFRWFDTPRCPYDDPLMLNPLRPSYAYMRRYKYQHWFR